MILDSLSIWLIAFASFFIWCYLIPYIVYNIKQCIYGSPSNSIAEADCVVINSDEITYADAVILSIESYEQEEERRSNNNGSISNISNNSSSGSSNSSSAEGKEDSDSSTTEREGPNESDRNKNDSYYTTNILVEARWIDVSLE
jgi:hypothetical protein